MSGRLAELGPVQAVVIAFADGSFEGRVLDELRRLRGRTPSASSISPSSPGMVRAIRSSGAPVS